MAAVSIMTAAAVCLFGIGGGTPGGSAAAPMPASDASRMAEATTSQLAATLPPAATTVLLVGTEGCARGDRYTPALTSALRRAGFGVVQDGHANPGARAVRYFVTQGWEDSMVLRLQVDDQETTQLFVRGLDGVLREAGPLSVRNVQ